MLRRAQEVATRLAAGRGEGMHLILVRDTALGCVLWFRRGLELEVRDEGWRRFGFWSTLGGVPIGCARWGSA